MTRSLETAAQVANLGCRLDAIDNSDTQTLARFAAATTGELPARLLPHQGNIGFGRSHNRLMAQAFDDGAMYYLVLNADGFLHPEALHRLVECAERHKGLALVEARRFPNEHPKIYDFKTLETPWCSAACLLIPRRFYAEIGGFDEGFFVFCEDVDLSWRARLAGAQCLLAADAFFFQDVLDRAPSDFVRWHMGLSMKRLLSRWCDDPPPAKLIGHLKAMLADLPEEAKMVGSRPGERLKARGLGKIADFNHYFGFAPFRWA
jgi:hypothetical protein